MERIVEYIWIDGQEPTKKLRSKARVLRDDHKVLGLLNIPIWTFDGSSTSQAITGSSDCFLKPVCKFPDPIRGEPHVLALCEVLNSDRSPHPSNTRAHLVATEECLKHEEALFGIEQEYTLYDTNGGRPYRWPE